MRSTLLFSLLSIAVTGAVTGCHDHGVPPGTHDDMAVPEDMSAALMDIGIQDDARHIVTFSMFAADYADALCAHYMACGKLDAAQLPACKEKNLRHTGWDQDVEIMKGRIEINELQCLDAVKNSRCDSSDTGAWITRCLQFLYVPHQTVGGTCVASEECTTGFCQHAGSDGGMSEQVTGCNGVCATPKGTGMTCRLNSDCASDSFCDTFGTQTCSKLGALNDPCTNPFGIGSGPSCQFGLICPTYPGASAPTCVVPIMQTALHGACDPFQGSSTQTAACGTGMYCQVQYTASTVACTGAPGDCTSAASVVGAYCDIPSGFCQDPTGGQCETKTALGGACDPNNEGLFSFDDNQCADGSACMKVGVQTASTCQAFGGANADCNGDTTCKVGFYCNSSKKCAPWFGNGQGCDTADHCAGGFNGVQPVCIVANADAGAATSCQVMKNVGQSCVPAFENGLCTDSDVSGSSQCTSSGVCAPKCF